MKLTRSIIFYAVIVVAVTSSCKTLLPAVDEAGVSCATRAKGFVVPYNCTAYLSPAGGSAAAVTELGLGTSQADHKPLFEGLPTNPRPASEIKIGSYPKGKVICFSLKTMWRGNEHWAFSVANDAASQTAFQDLDNSLKLGRGRILKQIAPDTWIMHMDDAASFLVDDSDDDVIIRIRLERE